MTPVIQTIWKSGEKPETMVARINDQLRQRDRWNGPGTIDWPRPPGLAPRHRSSRRLQRRDTTVEWQLHGGLYELHGQDWAITEAGIEYRSGSQVVLAEEGFPEGDVRRGISRSNMVTGLLHRRMELIPPSGSMSCGAAYSTSRSTGVQSSASRTGSPARRFRSRRRQQQ